MEVRAQPDLHSWSCSVANSMPKPRLPVRRYITYAAIPICAATAVWDLSTGEHAHSHEPHYPYLRIRSKEFPWGDCPLFDFNCGKEHAEEGEGEEEAEE